MQANEAHLRQQQYEQDKDYEERQDKRVRFAPLAECQEYTVPAPLPEVVDLNREEHREKEEKEEEEENLRAARREPDLPRYIDADAPSGPPPVVDFFSIVNRLRDSRESVRVPTLSVPRPPAAPPAPLTPMLQGVEYLSTKPAPPPTPPPPPEVDEEEEDEAAVEISTLYDTPDGAAPLLPMEHLRQAKTEPTATTSASASTAYDPYAYNKTSPEEFERQSQTRYYHQTHRTEATDSLHNAKPYAVPGLPYTADQNRFTGEVVKDPEETWRAGEAYVDLPRPYERRYELVFNIDEPRPANLNSAAMLTVQADFKLRFPDGALKKMAGSEPCKEKGYSEINIKMQTMQAELVAVLKLIALPRFGFRGKITQVWFRFCITFYCAIQLSDLLP